MENWGKKYYGALEFNNNTTFHQNKYLLITFSCTYKSSKNDQVAYVLKMVSGVYLHHHMVEDGVQAAGPLQEVVEATLEAPVANIAAGAAVVVQRLS